jgi:hypothetical protein
MYIWPRFQIQKRRLRFFRVRSDAPGTLNIGDLCLVRSRPKWGPLKRETVGKWCLGLNQKMKFHRIYN